jgi:hypothetical protein
MKLYKRGDCIVIWSDTKYQQYFYYTISEATQYFKKKYNIKGRIKQVDYCPYILN